MIACIDYVYMRKNRPYTSLSSFVNVLMGSNVRIDHLQVKLN